MTRIRESLRRRIGRRGLVLLLFSACFLFLGIKAFTDPAQDSGRFIFYTALPDYVRAVLWGFPALVGAAVALMSKARGDALGYAALCVPPIFVSASYLWSVVGYLVGATDYPYGWVSASTWLLISAVLLVCSGWPEPSEHTRRRAEVILLDQPEEETS